MDFFGVQSVDTVRRCTALLPIGRASAFVMPYSLSRLCTKEKKKMERLCIMRNQVIAIQKLENLNITL
jgi:hypothetical protein